MNFHLDWTKQNPTNDVEMIMCINALRSSINSSSELNLYGFNGGCVEQEKVKLREYIEYLMGKYLIACLDDFEGWFSEWYQGVLKNEFLKYTEGIICPACPFYKPSFFVDLPFLSWDIYEIRCERPGFNRTFNIKLSPSWVCPSFLYQLFDKREIPENINYGLLQKRIHNLIRIQFSYKHLSLFKKRELEIKGLV